jgi:hypothetical protein
VAHLSLPVHSICRWINGTAAVFCYFLLTESGRREVAAGYDALTFPRAVQGKNLKNIDRADYERSPKSSGCMAMETTEVAVGSLSVAVGSRGWVRAAPLALLFKLLCCQRFAVVAFPCQLEG